MARQREYQGDVTANIRGGYTPFLLKRDSHLDIYQNAVNAINEQHEKALEARGKVESSIDQIDLSPEESKWKQGFKESILKQIDDEARYGGYSTALSKATKLAQTAATSPALLGRAKYYQKFKEWNKELDNRTDIDETTKQWARTRPQNQYNYKPSFADDGITEIEGDTFSNYRTPLADVKWEKEALDVFRLLNPSRFDRETESSNFVDNTGSATGSRSSIEKITPEEIEKAMRTWYATHKEQVYQDWEIFNWSIDQKRKKLEDPNLSAIDKAALQQELAQDIAIQEKFGSDNLVDYANWQLSKYKKELAYTKSATGSKNDKRTDTGDSGSSSGNGSGAGYQGSNYSGGYNRYMPSVPGNPLEFKRNTVTIGFDVDPNLVNGLRVKK